MLHTISGNQMSLELLPSLWSISPDVSLASLLQTTAYTLPQKTRQPSIIVLTSLTFNQFLNFCIYTHYKKFATLGYIISKHNMVCVTALPCRNLNTTSFMSTASITLLVQLTKPTMLLSHPTLHHA